MAIIWINYGLYHVARIQALNSVCDLHAIELAGMQKFYGWRIGRDDCDVEVITLAEGTWEEERQLVIAFRLWRALALIRPEVVLIPGYSDVPSITAAIWATVFKSTPVMMSDSTHEDFPRKAWREAIKRAFVKTFYSYALVAGSRARRYAQELGIPAANIVTGYDVVDNSVFETAVTKCRNTSKAEDHGLPALYFLFVGRFAPEKNLGRLLSAFEQYRRDGGSLDLVLVGRGALESKLRQHAQALGVAAQVHFLGFKNGLEIAPAYAFARAFVLPSTKEPWGLVVNEAMASGLPVLISNRCGCSDDLVLAGQNGYVFDPENHCEIAQCMLQFEQLAESEVARMRMASSRHIRNYSLESLAASVKELIGMIRHSQLAKLL